MKKQGWAALALFAGLVGCGDSTTVCQTAGGCTAGSGGGGSAGAAGSAGSAGSAGAAGSAGSAGAAGSAGGAGGAGAGGVGGAGAGGAGAGGAGAGGAGAGGMGAGTTVLRIHYPSAGAARITVRGSGAGLDWMRGQDTTRGADVFEWRGDAGAAFEWKPLLDDATWAVGANFRATPGTTTDIWPFFQPSGGRVEEQTVPTPAFGGTRDVLVYLPPGYDENATHRYPVLVMQDGHNLFDARRAAFGVEWQIDEALDAGIGTSEVAEVIVLGPIPGDRMKEYTPTMDAQYGGGDAARYLTMLQAELLPWARMRYRVDETAEVGVGGSSLGGLFTTYACWTKSDVFRRCLAMSSSYWWDDKRLLGEVERSTAMPPIHLWLDSGDAGSSMDGLVDTLHMRDVLLMRGYRQGVDLWSYTGMGQEHNEAAWAMRFPMAVRALYPGRAQ